VLVPVPLVINYLTKLCVNTTTNTFCASELIPFNVIEFQKTVVSWEYGFIMCNLPSAVSRQLDSIFQTFISKLVANALINMAMSHEIKVK
jgi:hypothetical protein